MKILFACDNNYAKYLAVTLLSIFKHHQGSALEFYILDLGIHSPYRQAIEKIVHFHQSQVHFIAVNEQDFSQFPTTIGYISKATYARLKVADYLPHLDKILYLDIDVLVNHSLTALWQIQLEQHYLAAAFDSFIEEQNYKQQIGLAQNEPYFNAGVLLINLAKWREVNFFQQAAEWAAQHHAQMRYMDQDILNAVCKGKVCYVDPRFNFMPTLKQRIKLNKPLHEAEQLTRPIAIFHYCSGKKAWHAKCSHTNAAQFLVLAKEVGALLQDNNWHKQFEQPHFGQKFNRWRKDYRDKIKYQIQ